MKDNKVETFTHKANMWGVPVYYNDETNAIRGINRLFDVYLDILVYLELRWPANKNGVFEITIIRELTDQEKSKANRKYNKI